MLYVFYRNRQDPTRDLVLCDGAAFPPHLHPAEWYLHATHSEVTGRTEADIATLGYCDRKEGDTFGRHVARSPRHAVMRKTL